MSRNDDLPSSASPNGTSLMMMSGNGSLPALRPRGSISSNLDLPGTPRSTEGLPAAPNMAMYRRRHPRRMNNNHDDEGTEQEEEDDDNEEEEEDNDIDDEDETESEYSHEQDEQRPFSHSRSPSRHRHFSPAAILECPMDFLQCRKRFTVFQFGAWMAHSLEHFGNDVKPPGKSRCIFCWTVFDSPIGMANWYNKLVCAFYHHRNHGLRIKDAPYPDFALHQHMWEQGVLKPHEWKHLSELKAATVRRGRRAPSTSPSMSPAERDQEMMVMTTNTRRERHHERELRKRRQLEEQVARDEASD